MINRVDMYCLASSMSRCGTKAQKRLNQRDKGSKGCRLPPRVQLLPLEGKSYCGLERQSAEVGHSSGKIPDPLGHGHIRSCVGGKVSVSAGVIYSALTRSLADGLIAALSERFPTESVPNVKPLGIRLARDVDWV